MVIGGAQQHSTDIGSGGLPMWRWDLSIHSSDGLSWMRLMTDKVEALIGLHHCGNVVRRVVEFFFPLMIPRIEDSHGLTCFDFTEMSWRAMIQDNEFGPFGDFNLGV
jgi:hypothetical protein